MQTNSTIRTLSKLIVANALDNKPIRGLVIAYTEEFEHMCEYEGHDMDTIMPVVEGDACERVMFEEFERCYQAALDHKVSHETCVEVFEYPSEWALNLEAVPRALLTLVGRAMAKRDAAMANGLRRQAMSQS